MKGNMKWKKKKNSEKEKLNDKKLIIIGETGKLLVFGVGGKNWVRW